MASQNQKPGFETNLIPRWAYVLAVLVFAGVVAAMYPLVMAQKAAGKPIAVNLVWSVWFGLFVGFYVLMIGYVLRDSARRGMNPKVWLAIMIALLPSGLGFIVYFLMRQPIALECPNCNAPVAAEFNFCTKCQWQLKSVCTSCQRSLRTGDLYCAHCGAAAVERSQQVMSIR